MGILNIDKTYGFLNSQLLDWEFCLNFCLKLKNKHVLCLGIETVMLYKKILIIMYNNEEVGNYKICCNILIKIGTPLEIKYARKY